MDANVALPLPLITTGFNPRARDGRELGQHQYQAALMFQSTRP